MSETSESDQHEKDMLSMFASVWVKVEVGETEDNLPEFVDADHVEEPIPKKKKKTPRPTQELKCTFCDYTTVYKNCLKLHIMGHSNTKPYSCDNCNYTTKYPTSLHRHMIIQHDFKVTDHLQMQVYQCEMCSYSSYFKWNLKAHTRKHTAEKQYKCEQCNYATAYRHNFNKHHKVHNKEEMMYKCDKCPFVTKYEGHIARHLAKIHNEVSDKARKCDMCDFSTKVQWRLNVHKRRSKQNGVLKCTFCDFETSYMCESKKHKAMHFDDAHEIKLNESSGEITVGSGVVTMPLPDENGTIHEKFHNYTLDPNCEIDWHNIKVLESNSKDRPFQCIMCSYTSRFKASVQRHFQRHHTGSLHRPYKCVNCDFSTKTKDQIALHNKRSQSDTELKCTECNYVTFFKCQFATHQKCHYAHKCPDCSFTCKQKYDFQRHVATAHTGQTLQCRFCDYKAVRKESLLCHETIHTGQKPFKCKFCKYTTVRKSLLDNHLKRRHSDVLRERVIVNDSKIESLKVPIEKTQVIEGMKEQRISKEMEDMTDEQSSKDYDEQSM